MTDEIKVFNPTVTPGATTPYEFGRRVNTHADWLLSHAGHKAMRHYILDRVPKDPAMRIGEDGEPVKMSTFYEAADEVHASHLQIFDRAPLTFLTGDMVEFLRHTADGLPSGSVIGAQPPTTAGIMGFAAPPLTLYNLFDSDSIRERVSKMYPDVPEAGSFAIAAPVVAIAWIVVDDESWFAAYLPAEPGRWFHLIHDFLVDETGGVLISLRTAPASRFDLHTTPRDTRPGDAANTYKESTKIASLRLIHMIRTAWVLLEQSKLVEIDRQPATRQQRRAAERERARSPRDINVARIGRPHVAASRIQAMSETEIAAERKVKVRYPVRGHLRQQAWGPGWGLRKPVWIDPHWKGPEDGPVHYSRTVNLLDAPREGS